MGFTGSIFSMRSYLVDRCFAQNGPQDWENPLFQSFQCTPLAGGTRGGKQKNIAKIGPFSTRTHFLKPQRKIKFSTCFFDFFRVRNSFGLSLFSAHGPYRGRQGPKTKKKRSVFDENSFLKPQLKMKFSTCSSIFWVEFFLSVGARNFSKCPDPSKTQ